MRKTAIALCLLLPLLLGGCWDQVGMDEITIVSGIAIDREGQSGQFAVTLEIVNLGSAKQSEDGNETLRVESTGATVAEAFANAKARLQNKLYFGVAQVVVLSRQIAETEGIEPVVDMLLRDGELRETVDIIVSREETASAILLADGLETSNISFELNSILNDDPAIASSTRKLPAYRALAMLRGPGGAVTLPAVQLTPNGGDEVAEISGIACFDGGRLMGFLTPAQTRAFLLAVGEAKVAPLSFPAEGGGSIAMLIDKCLNETELRYEHGQLMVRIRLDATAILLSEWNAGPAQDQQAITDRAGEALRLQVTEVLEYARDSRAGDIFGFGNALYRQDPRLWEEVSGSWADIFRAAEFRVEANVGIRNTGAIKE